MEGIPLLSSDLIKELDEMFPERCPEPDATDREIWIYYGARSVVRMLLSRLQEQEELQEQEFITN